MKANFKAEKKIMVDYEIDLPYYCKSITSYYKIIDQNTAIKVEYWDAQYYCVAIISATSAFNNSDKPCAKEDFDLAFQQVNSYITHKTNE